jgi:predicted adenylyl cyclase CyaB
MIEVEAKVIVRNLNAIRAKIRKIARFVGKEKKIDDYYSKSNLNKIPKTSLRVRNRNGYYEINSKKALSYIGGIYAKRENELKVKDVKGLISELEDNGFRRWIRKEKTSEIYKIKNNFHIELNRVKHLGYFLEIEYLTNGSIEIARKEIRNVIKILGINEKEITKKGYTKMLVEKGINGF